MTADMGKFRGIAVSGSIKPWIDLAKERGMTEDRVFQNLLKGFERVKSGTMTEEELQAEMQAFIDACSAKATSETPRI
jgi:hypothetical protein